MRLHVHLIDGSNLQVDDFEKITFASSSDLIEVSEDNLDKFFVHTAYTYRFYGESILMIQGSQIKAIELY